MLVRLRRAISKRNRVFCSHGISNSLNGENRKYVDGNETNGIFKFRRMRPSNVMLPMRQMNEKLFLSIDCRRMCGLAARCWHWESGRVHNSLIEQMRVDNVNWSVGMKQASKQITCERCIFVTEYGIVSMDVPSLSVRHDKTTVLDSSTPEVHSPYAPRGYRIPRIDILMRRLHNLLDPTTVSHQTALALSFVRIRTFSRNT